MPYNRENGTRQDKRLKEVEKTETLLHEYAEKREITMRQAAEDVLNNWTQNWCAATPSFLSEGLMACELAGKIKSLAEDSTEIEDPEELVRRAVSGDAGAAPKA